MPDKGKRKMSLLPPQAKQDDKLKAFIEEPETKTIQDDPEPPANETAEPKTEQETAVRPKPQKQSAYPWQSPGVTEEIIKPFVLRMKQPDKLKAEYIVENSLAYRSLQDFCMQAILKQVKKELGKLKA